MAKQIATFDGGAIPAVALPDLSAAAPGSLLAAVDKGGVALTPAQTAVLLAALNAHMPGGAKCTSFSLLLQPDGSSQVAFRALRLVTPANVSAAKRAGLFTEPVGEVVDV